MPDTVSTPEPASEHPAWCDPGLHAAHGYHLGRRELIGERLVTKIVAEQTTRVLVSVEVYADGCEVHPEGVLAWSAAEARQVHALLGQVLDMVEAAS